MSWDKNTVNRSKLDSIAEVLTILEIPFKIETIGTVDGWGQNDQKYDEKGPSGHSMHGLRKLTSEKIVVLERIERTIDCDSDDEIVSDIFKPGDVPKEWPLESTIDPEYLTGPEEEPAEVTPPGGETIADGFGSVWSAWCPMCNQKSMSVVRPGKAQCNNCG